MAGIGTIIWKIGIALYLVAQGLMGIMRGGGRFGGGDFVNLFGNNIFAVIAGIIALIAGVFILLEMFNVSLSFLPLLILILTIIWVVIVVFAVIYLLRNFEIVRFAMVAVHMMIAGSLLSASRK